MYISAIDLLREYKNSIKKYSGEVSPSEHQVILSSDILFNVHDFLQKQTIQNSENFIHRPVLSGVNCR